MTQQRKFIAMDQIKEAEVEGCYEELEEVNLAKWRAGLSEFYNEAKQVQIIINNLLSKEITQK